MDNNTVSEPAALAEAAFDHSSTIVGSSEERAFSLSWEEIHPEHFDRMALERPFSEDEIWHAIKAMPTSKAPGPDGLSVVHAAAGILKKVILNRRTEG